MDTGPGQGGIWLVHEAHNGQLSLQVIGNGIPMGSEQKPAWLMFLKHHGYELALGLGVLGFIGWKSNQDIPISKLSEWVTPHTLPTPTDDKTKNQSKCKDKKSV